MRDDFLRDLENDRDSFENEVLLHGYSNILNRYAISETFARKNIGCNKLSGADAMIRIYGIDEATKLYNTLSIRAFMDIMISHGLNSSPNTLSDAFGQGGKKRAVHPKKLDREKNRKRIDERIAKKHKSDKIELNTVLWDRTEKPVHYEGEIYQREGPMNGILFNHPY